MAELRTDFVNDFLNILLAEEGDDAEVAAPKPTGLMANDTATQKAVAEEQEQPKTARNTIQSAIKKLGDFDTAETGEGSPTVSGNSVINMSPNDLYGKHNTPLYKLLSLNKDIDYDPNSLRVLRNTDFGNAYLDNLGKSPVIKTLPRQPRVTVQELGGATPTMSNASDDPSDESTFGESPEVNAFLEILGVGPTEEELMNDNRADTSALSVVDGAAVGGASDGKVDEGLMSRPAKDNVDAVEAYKAEVMEAQKLLGITVDADFGPGSTRAMASFQYKVGLPVSGKIDSATLGALRDPNSADPRNAKPRISVLNEAGDAPDMSKVTEWAKNNIADPLKAAAFVSTVESETGGRTLIEEGYSKKRAIEVFVNRNANDKGKLGPKMIARKAAIQALPSDHSADDIFNIVYGNRLGNDQPNDGSTYKGRGLIQITGKANYKLVGDLIGVDFVAEPELINDPKYAAAAAMAYLSLPAKNFFAKDVTQSSLAKTVGHSGGTAEAKKRFDRAIVLQAEMYP